jgi:isoleucyl-tRNA synthetase
MQVAQEASSLILSIRKKVNIKVRQPLQKAFIPALDESMKNAILQVQDIIKAETNIKEISILDAGNDFIRKKAKANFKTLGKKLGQKMKWAALEIEKFDNNAIELVQQGPYLLNSQEAAAGGAARQAALAHQAGGHFSPDQQLRLPLSGRHVRALRPRLCRGVVPSGDPPQV